jgi:hypothetical protein
MSDKTIADVMTDVAQVFMVQKDVVLDHKLMNEMVFRGHSRIPVYTTTSLDSVEYLMIQSLIHYSPADRIPISALPLSPLLKVYSDESPFDVLNKFQHFAVHIAGVFARGTELFDVLDSNKDGKISASDFAAFDANNDGSVDRAELEAAVHSRGGDILIGVVTLEDILEEILQEQILDERDEYVSVSDQSEVDDVDLRLRRKVSVIKRANLLAMRANLDGGKLKRSVHLFLSVFENLPSFSVSPAWLRELTRPLHPLVDASANTMPPRNKMPVALPFDPRIDVARATSINSPPTNETGPMLPAPRIYEDGIDEPLITQ